MTGLQLNVGEYSTAGRKPKQQDFTGHLIPKGKSLIHKGAIIAVADGISSSDVSDVASQTCIRTLLEDYYATPESWGTATSLTKVLQSVNAWLYAQSRNSIHRYTPDKGYVCTLSGLVIKSRSLHLFHVGDSRIFRVTGNSLEQLTEDHRFNHSEHGHYLTSAMGMKQTLDIQFKDLPVTVGDTFLLATDGFYEWLTDQEITKTITNCSEDLQHAAESLTTQALKKGSDDNISVQIVRVTQLPDRNLAEYQTDYQTLPVLEALEVGSVVDEYTVLRVLHQNHRSRIYQVRHNSSNTVLVLKALTVSAKKDAIGQESFLTEQWVLKRVKHPTLLSAIELSETRTSHYLTMECFNGQSLAQWRQDIGQPSLSQVRSIVQQAAQGLQALHRMKMLHNDIRPQNLLINSDEQIKLIDYGAVTIEGLIELEPDRSSFNRGELQYTAPERLLGWAGNEQSDLYALGCVTYYLISGRLPYGAQLARATSRAMQRKLKYMSLIELDLDVPVWVDKTLQKSVHVDPNYRYNTLSEFVYDLSHPNPKFIKSGPPPLIEKHPIAFWQSVSAVLLILVIWLVATHPTLFDTKNASCKSLETNCTTTLRED